MINFFCKKITVCCKEKGQVGTGRTVKRILPRDDTRGEELGIWIKRKGGGDSREKLELEAMELVGG